jgi:hypothetical protein
MGDGISMTIPDHSRSDVTPSPTDDDDWNCAGVISPRKNAQVEFRSKHAPHIHRGRFTGADYVDTERHVEYPARMVREWRYRG